MAVIINPDFGDTITLQDQGANWRVGYHWRDTETGEEGNFEANFPSDFQNLNPDEVEPLMVQLAIQVAINTGAHS